MCAAILTRDIADRPGSAGVKTDWVARARALRPLLEAAGPDVDRERQLPADVLAALHEAKLFRMLIPADLGGLELDIITFVQVVEAVAQGDGSTAWCLGQNSVCAMTAAYIPRAAAQTMFGDPRAALAWGAGPSGQAVETEGGFRVSGKWSFASGSRHATWLGGLCPIVAADGTPRLEADGSRKIRSFVFPKSACTVVDDWRVIGLRGTGSDSYAITDTFVPTDFHFLRSEPAPHPGALYRMPMMGVYPAAFGGIALGLARAVLDAFIAMAIGKIPRGMQPMRENAAIQSIIGLAGTRIASARAYLMQTLAETTAALNAGAPFVGAVELAIRMSTTFAIQESCAVVDVLYHEAGASAIMEANPFERRFRDLHSVAQQVQARRANFELVGQRLMGMETGPLMI